MYYAQDIDRELRFDDEVRREPLRIRNAVIVDNQVMRAAALTDDSVTSYAAHVRKGKQILGPEFGEHGGSKAKAYSRGAADGLHHKQQYAPVRIIYPDDD